MGQYGQDCLHNCSSNCVVAGQCNHISGYCQCQAGYQGTDCKKGKHRLLRYSNKCTVGYLNRE